MRLLEVLIIFSSLSFRLWVAYFTTPNMKSEFIRFGLSKFEHTAILEIVGAIGLLVGLLYNLYFTNIPGGLALLMFLSNSQA
jgi:hypothetical protein